jgi:hypothetical protein
MESGSSVFNEISGMSNSDLHSVSSQAPGQR